MTERRQSVRNQTTREFLYVCLRARWDHAALQAARTLTTQGDLDCDALQQLVHQEGLAPLLYSIVRGHHVVPSSVEQDLRQAYYSNAVRNALLFHELEEVLHHLTNQDLPVILLKGAALAPAIYGNIAVRPIGDLDLLVRRNDVPAALQALTAYGFEPLEVETHTGATVAYENEIMLCKRGKRGEILVDTHWSLLDSPYYQHSLPMDWFWQTARPLRVGKTSALMLGPEAQLLHLCAHMLLHHGGQKPFWLHDVAEVIAFYRTQIDWGLLLEQAQACNLVLPTQQVLARVADEWQAPIPPDVLEQLRVLQPSRAEARHFAWLTAKDRPVAQRFWADLAGLPGWSQRLRYACSNLFPSPAYMYHRYRIPHRLLVPLYYPYRWLLGLRSLVKTRT